MSAHLVCDEGVDCERRILSTRAQHILKEASTTRPLLNCQDLVPVG